MIDVTEVLVAGPDQLTTGAIYRAPLGTPLPTTAIDDLNEAFTSSGYVSEDGVSFAPDRSTEDIPEWGGSVVRTIQKSFTNTLKWSELQFGREALENAFGANNVQFTTATQTHGNQTMVGIGPEMPPAQSWVIKLKDGKKRVMLVVPNGQITAVDEVAFVPSGAAALPLTLSCFADTKGNLMYILIDDGNYEIKPNEIALTGVDRSDEVESHEESKELM